MVFGQIIATARLSMRHPHVMQPQGRHTLNYREKALQLRDDHAP